MNQNRLADFKMLVMTHTTSDVTSTYSSTVLSVELLPKAALKTSAVLEKTWHANYMLTGASFPYKEESIHRDLVDTLQTKVTG